LEVKRGENETYRGLMAKIQHSVNRFIGDEDPKVRLCEEFFLKALSPAQAQWLRRIKGSNSVVDAAKITFYRPFLLKDHHRGRM
jgi:hypothetical protein